MLLSRVVVVVGCALVLSGCLKSATLVKVKPDGSGTIEQSMLVNMQTFKGMMGGMGGQLKESGAVLNDAEFKRAAERMGARPISLTPKKDGPFEGSTALYAFDDISKIRVDQDPQMGGSTSGAAAKPPSSASPIRFTFARQGASSVLTLAFDEKANTTTSKGAPDTPPLDPAMMQMIKGVFQGFRIAIDLEVEGTIVKTNADYVSGNRVTLVEIDMAALLEDEAKLKALQSKIRPGATLSEVKPYLKDMKGVKINHPMVTIEYR